MYCGFIFQRIGGWVTGAFTATNSRVCGNRCSVIQLPSSSQGSVEISGNARKVADFLSALDDAEKYLKMFQQNLSLMSDKGDVEN